MTPWIARRRVATGASPLLSSVVCLLCAAAPSAALADTIFLGNGNVIRTDEARIDGARVVFVLHGARQAIPLALVERVVEDDHGGSAPFPLPTKSQRGAPGSGRAAAPGGRAQMIVESFGDAAGGDSRGGGVDPATALDLLRQLGAASDSDGAGGVGLDSLLGMLTSGLDGAAEPGLESASGLLRGLGDDLDTAQDLLPALARLGQEIFAPEYSKENASAAVAQLLRALAAAGVSRADLTKRARGLGLTLEGLERGPRER